LKVLRQYEDDRKHGVRRDVLLVFALKLLDEEVDEMVIVILFTGELPRPYVIAAAVGSLIIQRMLTLAIVPVSLVACRWELLK
jgi:hypothetical protein